MSVEDALVLFANQVLIEPKLRTLSEVGLGYIHLGQSSTTLSGGEAQRIKLARELSKKSTGKTLYFLDEPTTGLDPQARHMIWERLKRLLAEGKTIFLTTHFMDEAERLCDRLAVIDHGRMIAEGDPRSLIASHIETQVVEVYGENALQWGESTGRRMAGRFWRGRRALYPSAGQP